ncbi:MAG: hypothetical protein ACREFQ_05925, partial [Stellaceae bacterium]
GHPFPQDIVLPDDFPPVRLALPEKGFSPDYFGYGGDRFCSRHLREAMNLPEGVLQGGFKRSSQHSDEGGCDERKEAPVGTVWTSAIAVTGATICIGP